MQLLIVFEQNNEFGMDMSKERMKKYYLNKF
jgi:hypothetical protein